MNIANYGLSLWVPQIVKAFGLSNVQTGIVTAIPSAFAAVSAILWTRNSDRTGQRIGHLSVAALLAFIGLATCVFLHDSYATMMSICLASIGIYALIPMFWGWAPTLMAGPGAPAALAVINSVGGLSGYVAPYMFGYIKETTGSFEFGLLGLAVGPLLSAILIFGVFGKNRRQATLVEVWRMPGPGWHSGRGPPPDGPGSSGGATRGRRCDRVSPGPV